MKFKRIAVAVLSVYAATTSWYAWGAQDQEHALGHIGDKEVVTETDVSEYLDLRTDLRSLSKNVWGVENIIREMTLTRALVLEGESKGISRQEGATPRRFDDIYAHTVFQQLRPECAPPADEEATKKFFANNPKAFTIPPSARINRVMLPKSSTVDGEPAVGWLLNQIPTVGMNNKPFDDLVAKAKTVYNLDPQGDLGWVMLSDDIPLMRALAGAKEGDIVGPVNEGEFIYAFQIVSKREGRVLEWNEVAEMAANRAVRYCREQGDARISDEMVKKYGIEVDVEAIKAMFNRFEGKK
jgi:hypothetical protein